MTAPTEILGSFWRAFLHPERLKFALWFVQQCTAIARGMARIHQPLIATSDAYRLAKSQALSGQLIYGRHGNISPQTILWFNGYDSPSLMISGFDQSQFCDQNSSWDDVQT